MAGFGDLLQRISRSLEEASAQRPGGDLRERLGYAAGDDDEDELASETAREPEPEPEWISEKERRSGTVRDTGPPRTRGTAGATEPSRAPAQAVSRAPASPRAAPHDRPFAGTLPSAAAVPRPHASSTASRVSERLRARLQTPDALREAFVLKEILDRPLGRRRRR